MSPIQAVKVDKSRSKNNAKSGLCGLSLYSGFISSCPTNYYPTTTQLLPDYYTQKLRSQSPNALLSPPFALFSQDPSESLNVSASRAAVCRHVCQPRKQPQASSSRLEMIVARRVRHHCSKFVLRRQTL